MEQSSIYFQCTSLLQSNFSDIFTLIIFLFLWLTSVHLDDYNNKSPSLRILMNDFRVAWINKLSFREIRMADINTINILQHSINFIASTSIFIIAGLITALFNIDKIKIILADQPFNGFISINNYYKIFLPIAMFTYSYIKQIWAIRVLNITAVLIGALPTQDKTNETNENNYSINVIRAAKICSLATHQMSRGIKTSYFGFVSITWLFGNGLFIILSFLTALILYWLEYRSRIVKILSSQEE